MHSSRHRGGFCSSRPFTKIRFDEATVKPAKSTMQNKVVAALRQYSCGYDACVGNNLIGVP
jgi:hypothetical protein